MYLSDGKKETQYIVKDIGLPTGIEKRLEALGMTRGTSVTVLNSKSKGILIVKVRGTRFALGRIGSGRTFRRRSCNVVLSSW